MSSTVARMSKTSVLRPAGEVAPEGIRTMGGSDDAARTQWIRNPRFDGLGKRGRRRLIAKQRLVSEAEVLRRGALIAASDSALMRWYLGHRIPGFGGLTPRQLVREGRAAALLAHMDRIEKGGYA